MISYRFCGHYIFPGWLFKEGSLLLIWNNQNYNMDKWLYFISVCVCVCVCVGGGGGGGGVTFSFISVNNRGPWHLAYYRNH